MLIKNGRIVDPSQGIDALMDLRIARDQIAEIGTLSPEPEEELIDAEGLVVAPGLVDAHVHFRDPGQTYKETVETGAAAAAAGGFSTVISMANTVPPIDSPEVLSDLEKREQSLPVRVLNTANVTMGMQGKILTDMSALKQAGAVGFTDDGKPIRNAEVVLSAMKKCAELNVPISFHEEDPDLIVSPGVNQGKISGQLGLGGAPASAEYSLTARDCALALGTGCSVNIQHVSSAETVAVIRAMKQINPCIHAEVTPQHFSCTEDLVLEKGALAKVNPPLRTERDRQALLEGLKDGTLDLIVTDHAPHAREEKEKGIQAAPSGMIGLETSLALGITNLVKTGVLTLPELIRLMTVNPCSLYHLPYGTLKPGSSADVVLFDPEEKWIVPDHFHSKSSNSPFIGMTLTGRVHLTICRGKKVFRRGNRS
ncbi:MAG: dihydroorotase [Bulleidia sp.]